MVVVWFARILFLACVACQDPDQQQPVGKKNMVMKGSRTRDLSGETTFDTSEPELWNYEATKWTKAEEGKIWDDDECPQVGLVPMTGQGDTLDDCANFCIGTKGCTAFEYSPIRKGSCFLRECGTIGNVPKPQIDKAGFKGYSRQEREEQPVRVCADMLDKMIRFFCKKHHGVNREARTKGYMVTDREADDYKSRSVQSRQQQGPRKCQAGRGPSDCYCKQKGLISDFIYYC